MRGTDITGTWGSGTFLTATNTGNASYGWFTIVSPFSGTLSSVKLNLGTGTGNFITRTDAYLAISSDLKSSTTGFSASDFVGISTNTCGTTDYEVTMTFSDTKLTGGMTYYCYFLTKSGETYTTVGQRIYVETGKNPSLMSLGNVGSTTADKTEWAIPILCSMTLSDGLYYRMHALYPDGKCYINSKSDDENVLWKNSTVPTVTDDRYVWKGTIGASGLILQNVGNNHYISQISGDNDGSNATYLSATASGDAEQFTLLPNNPGSLNYPGYIALQGTTNANSFLNTYKSAHAKVGSYTAQNNKSGQFLFEQVKKVDFSTAVAVNGGDPVSTIYVACDGSDSFTLPAGYTYTFGGTTYTATAAANAIKAAGTEDITVTVAAVVTDLSNLSNSKKYKIICNRGGLSTYTATNTYLASPIKTSLSVSAKDFAILSYGGRYYLYSVDDEKFVTYQSETIAPLAENVKGTIDAITFAETASGSGVYIIKFNNDAEKILNSAGDDEYAYGIAINSWSTLDDGNQYVIQEVDDFESTAALAALKSFLDGKATTFASVIADLKAINWSDEHKTGQLNRYNLTSTYATYAGNELAAIENLESQGYNDERLNAAQGMLASYSLNMPTTNKFYRFHIGDNYMCNVAGNDNVRVVTTTSNDASTVFYLNDDNYLIAYADGYGFNYGYCKAVTPEIFNEFDFSESATKGYYNIHSNKGTGDETYSDRNITINGTTLAKGEGAWTIEEVETLPVNISAAGYATLNSPVALTIPTGVKAYTGVLDGTSLRLTEITTTIPANTAVILEGSAGTYNFAVTTAADFSGENALDGTIAEDTKPAGKVVYVLSRQSGNVGFYKYTGDYIPGFRAYLVSATALSNGFTFSFPDDDVTAVVPIELSPLTIGHYYDLQGRKVANPQKGNIYIQNGKKVLY